MPGLEPYEQDAYDYLQLKAWINSASRRPSPGKRADAPIDLHSDAQYVQNMAVYGTC